MLAVVICTVANSAFSDTDHVAVVEFVKGDPYTCTIIYSQSK